MQYTWLALATGMLVAACGDDGVRHLADAPTLDTTAGDAPPDDAPPDVPVDAGCTPLLVGGTDVAAQGWTVVAQAPNTLSYGADYVQLETGPNGSTSGQLLLAHANAVTATDPFRLEVEMLVQAVNPHNPGDAAAAILGSFTAPFGVQSEREQMIYLDAAAVGWADNAQSFTFAVTDGAYHTYVLTRDATQAVQLTIDGTAALTRAAFTSNGTIAIGDQTNDPNLDATVRIRKVSLCP